MKEDPETKNIQASAGEMNKSRTAGETAKQDEKAKQTEKAKKAAAKAKKKAERKERREVRRHKFAWAVFKLTLTRYFIRKFRYSYDSLKDVEGPYLLLANHNMELDPTLVGIAAGRQIYFVASEHIMRKGLGTWFLRTFLRPIIHTKGKTGTKSVMAIIKALKKGHNVCLFAEGNRSFNGVTGDILPSTGKLARAAGASLVTFRIEGGYLTQPRFSTSYRKGRTYGHLVHVYKPEELKAMTDDEMNEAINRDLHEDAYATQEANRIAYKGKNLTLGIESTLFWCPACKKMETLKSTSDEVRCSACGFTASFNEVGYLDCSDGVTRNMRDWDREQREFLIGQFRDGTFEGFSDQVTVRIIGADHKAGEPMNGELRATTEGVTFAGKHYKRGDISGLAVYSRNYINTLFGPEEVQYDLRGNLGFNALKYYYLYQETGKESES